MMHLTPASHPSTAAFVTESKFKWLEFQWLERTWSQQGRQKTQFFNSEPKPRQSAFVLGSLARSFQVIPTLICWAAMKTKTKQKNTLRSELRRGQEARFQSDNWDISKRVLSAGSLHCNVYKRHSSCYPKPYSGRWRQPHTPEWTIPFRLHEQQQKGTKLEIYPTGRRLQSCGASQGHSLSPTSTKIAFWLSVYSHYYWKKNLLWCSPCSPEKYFYLLVIKHPNTVHVILGKKINNNLCT